MKKLLALALVLLLILSGCTEGKVDERPTRVKEAIDNNGVNRVVNGSDLVGKDYIELLKNFVVRYKNKENTVDDKEFDEFLDDIFVETVGSDYLNMHYTVIDYRSYGIEKPELIIGEVGYDDPDISDWVDEMERLQSFDYDKLSYRQQYDYEMLEYSLLESIASAFYAKYDQVFTGGSDILSDLVTNFDEFIFYDKEMVDDYLVLLQDVDRYLDDCLDLTAKQAADGLYLTDYCIDYQADYVSGFVSKVDDNVLITSFNDRISELEFLSDAEKQEYKAQNEKIVKEEIIPEYQKIKEELEQYRGKATYDNNRLSNINKEYAELKYLLNTSTNDDIETLFEDSKDLFDDMIADFNTAIMKQKYINEYYDAYEGTIKPFNLDNDDTLEYLASHYSESFPDLGELKYEISYLDASSASDSVIAYYMLSPLDDLNQNVIRVNPNATNLSNIEKYTTIAHEGIPGHLYQHVYYYRTNHHNFRCTQGFIGSSEGYACYVERQSLKFTDLSKQAQDISFFDLFAGYIVLSICDMGVNCLNWTESQVSQYLEESYLNGEYASVFMDDAIDRSAILPRYGIGYLQFVKLRNYAEDLLGDNFDEVAFNEVINKNGILPFCMLKEAVNEYIYGD